MQTFKDELKLAYQKSLECAIDDLRAWFEERLESDSYKSGKLANLKVTISMSPGSVVQLEYIEERPPIFLGSCTWKGADIEND